ncbi:hypothetical protein [Mycolicibacterium palauense]|uniref:hypothetical protein n=1 Tax=Mycolicibacterium palauense TaxID=2034511 RepID=UPI000BFF00B9|nr:hypothetical protein [Mycolicibacterium palauense]
MRIALPLAAVLLVAGCSQAGDDSSGPISPIAPSTGTGAGQTPGTSTATSTAPPADGAPMSAVIAWVEGGRTADPGGFHRVQHDGVGTDLPDDVAFVTPSGKTKCMTGATNDSAVLSCLVDLADPPPEPPDIYGEWVGDWVDFGGTTLTVGAVHGDPGGFSSGTGARLDDGSALRFGDFQCRADPIGLICVNYAHQSAVRLGPSGVQPFGCLAKVDPPAGIGRKYSC